MPITKTFNNTSYSIPLEGELNWATLSNFLVALADYSQTINKQKVGMRVAIATPVTVLATTDCVIVTDLTTPGAVAVNLPAGVSGQVFTVVDGKGDAGTNNITITPAAGTINGDATYVIDSNRAGVSLAYNGTSWTVIAEFISAGDIPRNQIAAGTANHVVINDGSGDLSSEAALAASRGGLAADASAFSGYVKSAAGVFSAGSIAAGDLPTLIDATKIADGSVTDTEFQYINTLSSNAQTQIGDRVVGAASSTDNALARFDLATGKVIQNSGIIVDDSNNVTGVNDMTVTGDLTVNGATVTVNTATLDVEDTNITVNKGGNDASSAGAGLTVDRTGTKGSIIYDTTATSKFKAGDLASEIEIATISAAQVITNKDIDGGTAANTRRITIPKDTKTNLDALTRKEGTLVYASDIDKLFADDGSTLKEIGSGGSGINYLADYFTADTIGTVGTGNVTDTGDRTTGAIMSAWQSTNTTNISLAVSASSPLRTPNCYLFSGSGNNATGTTFVESPAFQLHVADLGKPVMVSFDLADVTADGNFDIVMVRYNSSGTYQEKISIAGNASGATPASAKLPLGITKFNGFFIASSTSTDYYALRFRRLAGTDVPRLDSIKVSPDTVIQGAAVTDWQSYTPTLTNLPTSAVSFFWKRIGDSMQVWGKATASGAATGIITIPIPSGYSIDTTKLFSTGANDSQVLGIAEAQDAGTAYYLSQVGYISTTAVQILSTSAGDYWRITVPHTWANTDTLSINFTVPIVGWSSNVTMANRSVEEYAFNTSTSTSTNDSTSFGYGSSGALIQSITTNLTRRVRFQTPIQTTDVLTIEVDYGSNGIWTTVGSGMGSGGTAISVIMSYGGTYYGMGWYAISTSKTDVDVYFGGYACDDVSYGSTGVAWSSIAANTKWRVRKVSGGASVGFPVSARNIVGDTSGTAVPSGYIGETIESSSTGTGKTLTNNAYVTFSNNTLGGVAGGVVLTPGKWSLTFSVTIEGSNSANYYTVAISTSTGSITPYSYGGENVFDILHNTPVSGIINKVTIANVIVNLSSTTNYYGIISASNNPTPNSSRGRLTAIRIA